MRYRRWDVGIGIYQDIEDGIPRMGCTGIRDNVIGVIYRGWDIGLEVSGIRISGVIYWEYMYRDCSISNIRNDRLGMKY